MKLLRSSALVTLLALASAAHADPCADAVATFQKGINGGWHADLLPDIVLGPPFGAGRSTQSTDVLSLGNFGSITLAFEDNAIVDGPGPDFTVFENAFFPRGAPSTFADVGIVSVSADGKTFTPFPFNAANLAGLAGVTPVLSRPGNGIDPRQPGASGGDSFDLAIVGLREARFVRIADPGAWVADPGNRQAAPGVGKSGFDLDAIVAIHSRETCAGCCDVNADGRVSNADLGILFAVALGGASDAGLCGASPCRGAYCADADQSGEVDAADLLLCYQMTLTGVSACKPGLCDFAD